jgi:hypothetical protein
MDSAPQRRSVYSYLRAYGRYIIPTWLFPVYFIGWGFTCTHLKLSYATIYILFFLTVGPPFLGAFLWANRARRHMSYWVFVLLTILVPFVIFIATALILAVGQSILKGGGI